MTVWKQIYELVDSRGFIIRVGSRVLIPDIHNRPVTIVNLERDSGSRTRLTFQFQSTENIRSIIGHDFKGWYHPIYVLR